MIKSFEDKVASEATTISRSRAVLGSREILGQRGSMDMVPAHRVQAVRGEVDKVEVDAVANKACPPGDPLLLDAIH